MSIEVNATEQLITVNATDTSIDVNVTSQVVDVNATTSVIEVDVSNGPGPQGPQGPAGQGVPVGGTTGQVLAKVSASNYDTTWINAGAGTVTSVNASGSVGISVTGGPITSSGTFVITNTAPDQVVALTGAGTATITGTYPNFTITANDQYTGTVTSVNLTAGTGISVSGGPVTSSGSINVVNTAPDQVVSLTGAGSTTISGTYPNFTITSADQYSGTVTSVNMSVPTGFTISGNPITSAGTLALAMASGYAIPTTASQANWDSAYNDKINSASVTGTTTKTLTLTQQDGGTITASWSDYDTAPVTSVFGRTGDVVAANGDYNTSQVTENTNLYFTNARSRQSISETITGIDYDNTTGVFSQTAGYSIPTNSSQTNWDTAYNDKINSAAVSGTTTKTLTLTQQDGGVVQASWTDLDTGLTSVGLSMPSAFSVSNSPLTSNGTIAVTGAGTATQYVRGDGSLADFPTSPGGGGASVSYYLNGSVNQGTFGGNTYYEMNKTAVIGTGTDFNISANGYIAQFITDANDPASLLIPSGNWNFEMYFSASSAGGSPSFYLELYKYNGTTFSLIATNSSSPELIAFGTTINPYYCSVAVPETVLSSTDRLALRIYVIHSGRTITLHTENSHLCQIITTFTTGLGSLNGLTAQNQVFATGTSGSDFNIVSSSATHTFNLPNASASNRGALSTADWTTFNNKQNAITLTTTGASGSSTFVGSTLNVPTYTIHGLGGVPETRTLTINGTAYDLSADRTWTIPTHDAVTIGTANGLSLSGQVLSLGLASGSVNGALSSSDWNTFNSKQSALSFSSPLVNTSGTISIPAATSLVNGYLTSADWTTFNSKQAALSGTGFVKISGTTISYDNSTYYLASNPNSYIAKTDLSAITPLSYDNVTGVFQMTQANSSTSGYLTSTDWNTFNNKQSALTNPVTGTGTTNYVPKFTGSTTIGNSLIYDSGSAIGVNTNSPSSLLDVRISSYTPTGHSSTLLVEENTAWTQAIALSVNQAGAYNSSYPTAFIGVANSNNTLWLSGGARLINNPGAGGWAKTVNSTSASFLQTGGGIIQFFTDTSLTANTTYTPSERMRLTSTGLGIGTSSPAYKLDVNGTATFSGITRVTSGDLRIIGTASNSSANGVFAAFTNSSNSYQYLVQLNASYGLDFYSYTGGNFDKRMTLDASGNLGLGVTPSAWGSGRTAIQLQGSSTAVYFAGEGNTVLSNNYYYNAGDKYIANGFSTQYLQGASGQHAWYIAPNNTSGAGAALTYTQAMTLDASGNLMVGTTTNSSGFRLNVVSSTAPIATFTGATNGYIDISDGIVNSRIQNSGGLFIGTTNSYDLNLRTNATTRLTINASTGAATFSSSVTAYGALYVGQTGVTNGIINSNDGMYFNIDADASGSTPEFMFGKGRAGAGSGGTTFMTIANSGNVGIGTTSPEQLLTVAGGSISVSGNTGLPRQILELTTASTVSIVRASYQGSGSFGDLALWTGGSERLRITSGGLIGIGTTSPSRSVHILGQTGIGTVLKLEGASGTTTYLQLSYNGATDAQSGYIGYDSSANMPFFTNNTERLRITSGGNVLVGTTSDYLASKEVIKSAGTDNSTNILSLLNSSGTDFFRVRSDGYTYAYGIYANTTASAANVFVGSGGDILRSTSSIKYKTDIRNYDKGLDIVNQLRPVYYKGKNDGDNIFAGLIAEEVHDLGLTEFVQYAEDGTPDALAYSNMVSLLVKAIQELKAEIDILKNK